jgi:hypothetical protein
MADIVVFRGMPFTNTHGNLKWMIELALQLANEQRNAYGLRYNDFTRYR